jgi:vacuolar-type H+-ATPase subunit H
MTGFIGLHEATQTINSMKAGRAKAIEAVASVGDKLLEDATKAAYLSVDDATVSAMKALISSTTSWQSKQKQLQKDLREQSARNAEQISKDAEAGRQAIIAAAA